MNLKIEKRDDTAVLVLHQNLNVGSDAAKIQNAVLDLIQEGSKKIAIDLSNLNFITSWGIGILIYAFTTCTNRNVEFSLVGVNSKILAILKKVKVNNMFEIETIDD